MIGFKRYNKKLAVIMVAGVFITVFAGCGGKADKLYEEGLEQYNDEAYDDAISSFTSAIELNPDKAEYYIGYGMALVGNGEYEEARNKFQEIIRDTDNRIVRENNKRAYRGIAISYYNEGNYEQAKGYLELAMKTDGLEELDNDLMAYMANCELLLNNYDKSLDYWNKLIEAGEKSSIMSVYYTGRAKSQNVMGNNSGAIADYQSAIKEDDSNYEAYLGLYLTLLETMDENGAGEVLAEALDKIGDDEEDIIYSAIFHYYQGEYDTAETELDNAYELGHNQAVYYKGRIYQDKQDYEKAIECFNEYLTLNPGGKNAEFCNQLGGCLIEQERYEEAIEIINQGVAMAAGGVRQRLLYNQVITYEHLGDYETAGSIATEYIKEYSDDLMQKEYEYIKTRNR